MSIWYGLHGTVEVRQVPVGNLVFKAIGVILLSPLAGTWLKYALPYVHDAATVVVLVIICRDPKTILLNQPASLGRAFHPEG